MFKTCQVREVYNRLLQAIRNIGSVLVAGAGRLYLRDYSAGDLAEQRLHRPGRVRRLARRAYCRNDGTRTYFFTEVLAFIRSNMKMQYKVTYLLGAV